MDEKFRSRRLSRRDFLRWGGILLGAAAGARFLPTRLLNPATVAEAAPLVHSTLAGPSRRLTDEEAAFLLTDPPANLHLAATDGWIYLPPIAIPPYHPDDLAPPPFNGYIFGFRNVTGLTLAQAMAFKGQAEHPAPLFWLDQVDPNNPNDMFVLQLSNLGFVQRPDLTDPHTVHFHGFRHPIPFFDGEPFSTLGVPIGRSFKYIFRPRDPGTYMYHCHAEDTEHVHMGMAGAVFVRPAQNGNTLLYPSGKYAYNDGDGSTGYDREFAIILTEFWAEAHWTDSHIQLPEWTDYNPNFYMMNGRVYPDTLVPNGTRNPDSTLTPPAGRPELERQPLSTLIQANAGERILLRLANLGYRDQSLTLAGLKMHVVGKDATLLRNGTTDISYETNTVSLGPGESVDAIVIAPGVTSLTRYPLYSRNYARVNNGGVSGVGGQVTEVHIYPAGTLAPQTQPNELFEP